MSCYTSTDLLKWKNQGLVFSVSAEGQHEEVAEAGILDRPKVFFNASTDNPHLPASDPSHWLTQRPPAETQVPAASA